MRRFSCLQMTIAYLCLLILTEKVYMLHPRPPLLMKTYYIKKDLMLANSKKEKEREKGN